MSAPKVRPIFAALFGLACLVSAGDASAQDKPQTPEAEQKDGVLIHVKSGAQDPHAALMALRMAEIMAEDHDVLVYFDVKGIDLVLRDAPNVTHKGFASLEQQLRMLEEKGVGLYACPSCLEVAGKSPEDLREGVEVATKEAFFDFTKGRILTLTY